MPITKSGAKHVRSDAKRRDRNQAALSEIKTIKKNFRLALIESAEKGKEAGDQLIRRADKAASQGVMPKGRANRIKSRIALALKNRGTHPSK